jgi:hypothetical protein
LSSSRDTKIQGGGGRCMETCFDLHDVWS